MKKYQRIYRWVLGISLTLIFCCGIMSEIMREIINPVYKTSWITAIIYMFFFIYGVFNISYMVDYSINKGDYNDK